MNPFGHFNEHINNRIKTQLDTLEYVLLEENTKKSHYILKNLEKFSLLSNVKEIRQQGMVTTIELEGYDSIERIGLKIYEDALTQGVLLRPLGHVIYFMPPYIISYEEIDKMIEVAYQGIVNVLKKS